VKDSSRIYRPPSEASSLIIQATVGCPYNRCAFCSMYKGVKFKIRPLEEIKEELREAREKRGEGIKSLFLADGNTIIMKTEMLEEILLYARSLFPRLERVTLYGAARYVDKKGLEELRRLRRAGLTRLHMGMESGDPQVLARINKGCTPEQIIHSCLKLKQAGIEISLYYLAGIGGPELSQSHALNSARVVNEIRPQFLRIRTYQPVPGSPLYEDYLQGKFRLLSPHQALREIKLLIENLECEGTLVLSDHYFNYWDVSGRLMQDRTVMLNEIECALVIPEEILRPQPYTYL